ncbi:MAG: 1-(5-phosphoribosyl)-5-[(5-phosphoribosylamino)methylideneamino]imidazole-4-carboxamide isomerase [Cyanobacteria bacterium]|nr:1-(5-phosphoribosyl)-5-[(5-phosphoribosylamino)methylideneamino]imidazole-4-carboxamide isomerase [Cyanobacteriota bacterium]MDA1020580.1 1-(5-phosphoribosyl)-5-[(5-phosphoribosylamino)methylideneamino]imidazole-4-carboxamide isomerase [Cyanobacteriota bacterium]
MNQFNIYTAIDLLNEKCVRLYKGDYDQEHTYNKDPIFVAKRWQSLGAKYMHIVDLDGARDGKLVNRALIKLMVHELVIPVQVGGGIRNMDALQTLLDAGVTRVILGSAIVKDPDFVKAALQKHGGDKVVLGIDCKDGYLAVEGWLESSNLKAQTIVEQFQEYGLTRIVFTDIDRDGTLEGPNIQALEELMNACPNTQVIASGGISNIDDVYALKKLQNKYKNLDGVIIGKALYEGKVQTSKLYTDEIYN